MKGLMVLTVGMGLLLASFLWAISRIKALRFSGEKRSWLFSYTALIGVSLTLSVLLCLSAQLERFVSVDSYVIVFDGMSGAFLLTTVSGLIVVARSRGWVLNVICFLSGATVAFAEFLGR